MFYGFFIYNFCFTNISLRTVLHLKEIIGQRNNRTKVLKKTEITQNILKMKPKE